MNLYMSFEQESMVAGGPDAPVGAKEGQLFTGYITIADGDLYDGPGAKSSPGNVLAYVGPIGELNASEAKRQMAGLLRKLGHTVKVCGEDY